VATTLGLQLNAGLLVLLAMSLFVFWKVLYLVAQRVFGLQDLALKVGKAKTPKQRLPKYCS